MKKKSTITFLLIAVLAINGANGQKVSVDDNQVALKGYDLVAYFNEYKAVRGSIENAVSLDGVTYYFSSADNATKFQADPSTFQPQFGGYCAFAVAAQKAKIPADPQTFKIRDGKLYLFFNDYYEGKPFNTIIPWNSNEVEMLKKANDTWRSLESK